MKPSKQSILLCLFSISLVLALNGCANFSIVKPVAEADPFLTHRWLVLGGAIVLGFVQFCFQLAFVTNSKNSRLQNKWGEEKLSGLIFGILGIPLMWTKIGEWSYLILNQAFVMWNPYLGIVGFLCGLFGKAGLALSWTVLFGFVFPVPNLFYWAVLPTLAGMILNMVLAVFFLASSSKPNNESK